MQQVLKKEKAAKQKKNYTRKLQLPHNYHLSVTQRKIYRPEDDRQAVRWRSGRDLHSWSTVQASQQRTASVERNSWNQNTLREHQAPSFWIHQELDPGVEITHTHTHTHTHALSLSHTHTHSLSHTHTLSLSHPPHTHAHTHTQSIKGQLK